MSEKTETVKVDFHSSLAMSISVALSLLGLAEEYDGFDPSIYSMYDALQNDLKQDIRILFKPFSNLLLFDGLLRDGVVIDDIREFLGWISRIPAEHVATSNLVCLRGVARHAGVDPDSLTPASLQDRKSMSELLTKSFGTLPHLLPYVDRIAELIANPEALRSSAVYAVARFWDRHYKAEYMQMRKLEEQSVASFEGRSLDDDFGKAFREITGREYPVNDAPSLDGIRRVIFVPSFFPGPYVSVDELLEGEGTLSVVYSCRPTGGANPSAGLPIDEMLAPLKALADETRLEILGLLSGRELYAQEIVDRMRVSQSAVSRHLRLMVASGILHVRKQEGMKFYTIDDEVLCRLGERLSDIPGAGGA